MTSSPAGEQSMFERLERLADAPFSPHINCYLHVPELVWLQVVSDLLIGLSYVAISLTLAYLVFRIRNLPFWGMFLAFGVFIVSCGLTHFMEVVVVWDARYWLQGFIKALTAVSSVGTAILLPPLIPKALALVRIADLSEERKRRLETTNAELERLYKQVTHLDQLRTEFFANVSHELRTPLTLILGPTRRLLGSDGLTPEQRQALETVALNAGTLLKHVNDLLDVARLEAKGTELRYAVANLSRLVRVGAAHFEVLAAERRIALVVETPEALPAQVDVEKGERVLLNLLSNAFKFAPDGGRVRVSLWSESGEAVLAIADSGPGVSVEMREAIFERFRQGEGGSARRHGGTGLGLAIAREFVGLHQGTLAVDEAPEGGALFTVTLPLAAPPGANVGANSDPAGGAETARQEEVAALHGRPDQYEVLHGKGEALVLVVDDNPDMRRFVGDTLAGEFRTATASDGQEGLQKALELRPDLVLSDVMMPGHSGDEMVRQIRARRELAGVPVVLLTAKADDDLRVRMLREGAADYLVKPFAAEELRVRVGNLVAMKRARDVLLQDAEDRQSGLEFLAREVSLRKREAEAALEVARTAREQAQHATRVKSHFLRMMSHELRTPLTPLILNLASLRRDRAHPLTPAQEALAGKIAESANRLRSLIESVLEYAGMQSARPPGLVETLNLSELAAEVTAEARPEAARKGLVLRLTDTPGLAPLHSDGRLVRLVLANLIDNAVKFTERGEVEVTLAPAAGGAAIAVRDTGPGMPTDRLQAIFEPFEHLEPVQRKHTPGIGLGLAVVRELVQSLGGRIEVDSQVGRGSTFTVVLPSLHPEKAGLPKAGALTATT
jgi:signal transduction histidine kinase